MLASAVSISGGWIALLFSCLMIGMLVNASSVNEIFRNLKTEFHRNFDQAPNLWMRVASLIPSTGRYNDYSWISYFPRMREWLGERQIRQLEASNYVVRNRKFEATIAVARDDIEDDQLGIYGNQARMAGYSAGQFPDELVFGLLAGGFARTCHDGQFFFDTDHPVGDAQVSNKMTKALSIDTYAAARAERRHGLREDAGDEGPRRPAAQHHAGHAVRAARAQGRGARALQREPLQGRAAEPLQGHVRARLRHAPDVGDRMVPAGLRQAPQAPHLPGALQARVQRADRVHGPQRARLGLHAGRVPLRRALPRRGRLRPLADGLRQRRHGRKRFPGVRSCTPRTTISPDATARRPWRS